VSGMIDLPVWRLENCLRAAAVRAAEVEQRGGNDHLSLTHHVTLCDHVTSTRDELKSCKYSALFTRKHAGAAKESVSKISIL